MSETTMGSEGGQLRIQVEECLSNLIPKNIKDPNIQMFFVNEISSGLEVRIREHYPNKNLYTKLLTIQTFENGVMLTIWLEIDTSDINAASSNIEKLRLLLTSLEPFKVKEFPAINHCVFAMQFNVIDSDAIDTLKEALKALSTAAL